MRYGREQLPASGHTLTKTVFLHVLCCSIFSFNAISVDPDSEWYPAVGRVDGLLLDGDRKKVRTASSLKMRYKYNLGFGTSLGRLSELPSLPLHPPSEARHQRLAENPQLLTSYLMSSPDYELMNSFFS